MKVNKKALLANVFILFSITFQNAFADETCKEVKGFDSILNNDDFQYFLVGELHGSNETPEVFGSLVCAALNSEITVLVGLELDESLNSSLSKFINSLGQISDVDNFINETNWGMTPFNTQDGRQSQAMLNLIKELQILKTVYPSLNVVSFVVPPTLIEGNFDQLSYEQGMADYLIQSTRNYDSDLTMVLSGNTHSTKVLPNSNYTFMAALLPKDSTASVRAIYSSGSAWNCQQSICGISEISSADLKDEREIVLVGEGFMGHDGYLNIGDITAALPVKYQE